MQPASGDAAINVPAATFRMAPQALAGSGSQGVIAPPVAVVTQRGAGANFSVDIAAFQGIVTGDDVTDQGSYLVTNTATFNLATPSAPGSGTRTHRLVAQVRDKRANAAWSTYDWTPVIVQDSGSGEPAEPASSATLAHIVIAAGQANVSNANITQGYTVLGSLKIQGPWWSTQAGAGSWNVTGTWVAYSVGNWPAVTFTAPPSGLVMVTVSAGPITSGGGTSAIGFSMSGTDTLAASMLRAVAFSATGGGGGHVRASKRTIVAVTPGGTDTISAAWFQGQSGGNDTADGQLIVEAIQ